MAYAEVIGDPIGHSKSPIIHGFWLGKLGLDYEYRRTHVTAAELPGYFRQRLFVYERTGKPCRRCRTPIRQFTQGQRSTYWCPRCQR